MTIGYLVKTPLSANVHASPIVGDTVLYSTLEPDCAFYRANASTGETIWRHPVPRRDTADPSNSRCGLRACARVSSDEHSVHFGTDNNSFVALAADTGALLWSRSVPYSVCIDPAKPAGQQERPCEVYSTALLAGGFLRIQGSEDGQVRAFDATTGAMEWSVAIGEQANGSPVVNPTNSSEVIIGADDGFLHCLATATGRGCGRLATCGSMDTLPSVDVMATGRLFYTCFRPAADVGANHRSGWVGAVDMHTFTHQWTAGESCGIPLFTPAHPDVVFVGYMNGSIAALSAARGEPVWMTNSGGGEFFGSLVFEPRRGLLYGVHVTGILIAVDPYVPATVPSESHVPGRCCKGMDLLYVIPEVAVWNIVRARMKVQNVQRV